MHSSGVEGSRIGVLDALRFVAALFVVFGHVGNPPLTGALDRSDALQHVIIGVYNNLFPAVPAVIVFFVISGFCIHYPFRHGGRFQVPPFLARRYLRIGIPLAVAVLLARPFDVRLALFHNSILWSLAAELIYYTLYPGLRWLRARWGWGRIVGASYLLACGGILVHPEALDYSPFGIGLNWLIAAPCWLLGCWLAEVDFAAVRWDRVQLWSWRLGVWGLGVVCSVLRFHSPVGYPWTLNLFAIAVALWLRVEIAANRVHPTPRVWAWAGLWSYSMYLVHMIANSAFERFPGRRAVRCSPGCCVWASSS